jgi:hypothetical protein
MKPNNQTTDELLKNALAALAVITIVSIGAMLVELWK